MNQKSLGFKIHAHLPISSLDDYREGSRAGLGFFSFIDRSFPAGKPVTRCAAEAASAWRRIFRTGPAR